VTEFGSFDNSTCKRVLDLLEPDNLTLGQVVIKRVAVVELGVKYIGCDSEYRLLHQRTINVVQLNTGKIRSFVFVRNILLLWWNMHPETVSLHVLGELLVFLLDLAVLLFSIVLM